MYQLLFIIIPILKKGSYYLNLNFTFMKPTKKKKKTFWQVAHKSYDFFIHRFMFINYYCH